MHESLTTYGVAFSLANFCGVLSLILYLNKKKIDINLYLNHILLCFITAPIGARALYVLLHHDEFNDLSFLSILNIFDGGLSFYGGLAVFFPVFYLYTKANQQSVITVANNLAPSLSLALAIIRIGCFVEGCCSGIFIASLEIIYPSQIVESVFLFILSFFLFYVGIKKKEISKKSSIVFIFSYSFFRLITDFLREDHYEHIIFNYVSVSQILSIVVLIPAIFLIFKSLDKSKKN
ncbi:MAG: prolipoprotein diacylglyceryl transferase [Oligoflexia bacterium]|nr:prolipoprotein diacylglyceryl transferase [Oligoflexia bacterium]